MAEETYTIKQAMKRLGLKSRNALFQLEKKYPESFVIVKRRAKDGSIHLNVRYDKARLDQFAESGEYSKRIHYEYAHSA